LGEGLLLCFISFLRHYLEVVFESDFDVGLGEGDFARGVVFAHFPVYDACVLGVALDELR
jgi:hypothetical protein